MALAHALLAAALLSMLSLSSAMLNNYAAAECCVRGPRCAASTARVSGFCKTRVWMSQQPQRCRKAACLYCKQPGRRASVPVCRKHAISKNCFGGANPPSPASGGRGRSRSRSGNRSRPSKRSRSSRKNRRRYNGGGRKSNGGGSQRSAPKSGNCAYRASDGNKIVIDASQLSSASGWSKDNGFIIYKKGNPQGSVDAEGSGTMCVKVVFNMPGVWYFTALTMAPHPTEHNDMWVKSSSGFDFVHTGKNDFRSGGQGWYKGYQNSGGMQMADYLLHVDNNGHQFQTKSVNAGQPYSLCIAGRSTKFWVRKLVLIKCDGNNCNRASNFIRSKMNSLPASACK